jgi:hypothetical protein
MIRYYYETSGSLTEYNEACLDAINDEEALTILHEKYGDELSGVIVVWEEAGTHLRVVWQKGQPGAVASDQSEIIACAKEVIADAMRALSISGMRNSLTKLRVALEKLEKKEKGEN